jgi:hypothetical protein
LNNRRSAILDCRPVCVSDPASFDSVIITMGLGRNGARTMQTGIGTASV